MKMSSLVVLAGVILTLTGRPVSADEYESCMEDCAAKYNACLGRITAPNDIEIEEAKAKCSSETSVCTGKCQSNYEKSLAPEQTDENSQEQPGDYGKIKTYKFEN